MVLITGCNTGSSEYTFPEETNYEYEVLEQWQPYEEDTNEGIGLTLLLKEDENDLSREGVIEFIDTMKQDKDPVNISIYLTQKAYDEEQSGNYTSAFDRGFLLVYIKNTTVNRAYYGVNEIRWMQEEGRFSGLFGETTEL